MRAGEKQQKVGENLLLYNNKYKNINIIYNNNMTKCVCAWIVACHGGLPIFWLFDLHFCKVCLHFSYVPFRSLFSSSACQNLPPCHFLVDNLRHEWQAIDFKRFFLAKTLAKTCRQCRQNAKSLILNGFFLARRVMSLFIKLLLQIVILISIKLFNTIKNAK